jgi:hypothetical protein
LVRTSPAVAPSGRARTNASQNNRTFGTAGTRGECEQHRERAADEECSAPVTQARPVREDVTDRLPARDPKDLADPTTGPAIRHPPLPETGNPPTTDQQTRSGFTQWMAGLAEVSGVFTARPFKGVSVINRIPRWTRIATVVLPMS